MAEGPLMKTSIFVTLNTFKFLFTNVPSPRAATVNLVTTPSACVTETTTSSFKLRRPMSSIWSAASTNSKVIIPPLSFAFQLSENFSWTIRTRPFCPARPGVPVSSVPASNVSNRRGDWLGVYPPDVSSSWSALSLKPWFFH